MRAAYSKSSASFRGPDPPHDLPFTPDLCIDCVPLPHLALTTGLVFVIYLSRVGVLWAKAGRKQEEK